MKVQGNSEAFYREHCGEDYPVKKRIEGRATLGGATQYFWADRPCLLPPGHDGQHRDIEGREW